MFIYGVASAMALRCADAFSQRMLRFPRPCLPLVLHFFVSGKILFLVMVDVFLSPMMSTDRRLNARYMSTKDFVDVGIARGARQRPCELALPFCRSEARAWLPGAPFGRLAGGVQRGWVTSDPGRWERALQVRRGWGTRWPTRRWPP